MPKTAKDYPLTLNRLGVNTDDDDQLNAIDGCLTDINFRSNINAMERAITSGDIDFYPKTEAVVKEAIGAALQRAGVRPEELRR